MSPLTPEEIKAFNKFYSSQMRPEQRAELAAIEEEQAELASFEQSRHEPTDGERVAVLEAEIAQLRREFSEWRNLAARVIGRIAGDVEVALELSDQNQGEILF